MSRSPFYNRAFGKARSQKPHSGTRTVRLSATASKRKANTFCNGLPRLHAQLWAGLAQPAFITDSRRAWYSVAARMKRPRAGRIAALARKGLKLHGACSDNPSFSG